MLVPTTAPLIEPKIEPDTSRLQAATQTAQAVLAERFADAGAAFLGGSFVRGEATASSDLDLVVLYASLPNAYRSSFMQGTWPVEVFVHDLATLRYFFDDDSTQTGVPSLMNMVAEGISLLAPNDLSHAARHLAEAGLAAGPPAWSARTLAMARYALTDLADDLRAPRCRAELLATATALYPRVADFYLRTHGLWSAHAKTIPRHLQKVAPEFAAQFIAAFQAIFEQGQTQALLALCEQMLSPHGGWLFDGHLLEAPPDWRA